MNFLAHLYLADDTDEFRLGSVLADFVRVPNERLGTLFGERIAAGVLHHRRVDAYTDTHPLVNECVGLLFWRRRHAARIVVDILYDHFLSRHWTLFAPEPLSAFIEKCHATLGTVNENDERFPEHFRSFAQRFVEHRVLPTYATLEGVAWALERVALRTSYGHRLRGGLVDIERDYERLERRFLEFFPQLRAAAGSVCDGSGGRAD